METFYCKQEECYYLLQHGGKDSGKERKLLDFLFIQIETISMEKSILYFKDVSLKYYCSYIKIAFILANSAGPDEMPPLKRHFIWVFTVCQRTCE